MNDDKVGLKDILSYLAAIGVLLFVVRLPAPLLFRIGIGLVLSLAALYALQSILHPKSPQQRLREINQLRARSSLNRSAASAAKIRSLAGTGVSVSNYLNEIASTADRIINKYRSREGVPLSEVEQLERYLEIFVGFVDTYAGLRTGNLSARNRDDQIRQAEGETIPKMAAAMRSLEENVDSGKVDAMDIAEAVLKSIMSHLGS